MILQELGNYQKYFPVINNLNITLAILKKFEEKKNLFTLYIINLDFSKLINFFGKNIINL